MKRLIHDELQKQSPSPTERGGGRLFWPRVNAESYSVFYPAGCINSREAQLAILLR